MNKRQYLESLREYLSFELPDRLVKKNLEFYEDYFEQQIREGKTAAQVIEELGDAQLIAKSCIDAEKAGADGIPENQDDNSFEKEMYAERGRNTDRGYYTGQQEETRGNVYGETSETKQSPKLFQGAGCLLSALILLGLVCLVIAFFSSSVGSVFLTILILFALARAITKLFR